MDIYDVIIIGSGPAGYTAAIYTSRAFLKTIVLTGSIPGGQLTTTTEVENYPGFPEGIHGPLLLDLMKKQAERFGANIIQDTVLEIKKLEKEGKIIFILKTESGEYTTRSVIIATGANAKKLGLPSEEIYRGKGISYCATCDGFFFRGKNIAVLGGGDTAMEEATFLTRFAQHVTIIHRRDKFRASPIMFEKAKKDLKISFLTNMIVEEFYGDTVIQGIKIRENKEKNSSQVEIKNFPVDGVFVAIGHTPATDFLKNTVELDEKGYIITKSKVKSQKSKLQVESQNDTNEFQTATSVPGVFAAGDCVDSYYRQGVVAAGMGAMAAIDVERWLNE